MGLLAVAAIVVALAVSNRTGPAASVTVGDDRVVVRLRGLNRLWALRGKVVVPRRNVQAATAVSEWPRRRGWRFGTYAPGAVVAGTFRGRGYVDFWACRWRAKRVLVIDLEGHRLSRLILDVADPEAVAAALQPA